MTSDDKATIRTKEGKMDMRLTAPVPAAPLLRCARSATRMMALRARGFAATSSAPVFDGLADDGKRGCIDFVGADRQFRGR